jgi:hypothetical protein
MVENEPSSGPPAPSDTDAASSDPGAPAGPGFDAASAAGAPDGAVTDGAAAEEYSDEDSDDDLYQPGSPRTALPRPIEAWRRRTALGAVLTGFALGLQEALELKRQDVPIVVQTSGTPPKDLPVEADLGDLMPSRSVVHVRPWLLGAERSAPADNGHPSEDST